jgi:hypothetical protein
VTTDLDTLAAALYVRADDLLKESPQLGPWRPAAGISPRLSDAELVTLAVMQALPGFTSEARWLRHARAHLRHLLARQARTRGRMGEKGPGGVFRPVPSVLTALAAGGCYFPSTEKA